MGWESVNVGDTSKAIAADVISSLYFQGVKLVDPTDGSNTPLVIVLGSQPALPQALIGSDGNPLTFTNPDELTASPSIGTSACTDLDSLHTTVMTFAQAANSDGGTGRIIGARLVSHHNTWAGTIRLWLFRKSVTGTTANTTLAVGDSDKDESIGWIDFDFSGPSMGGGYVAVGDRGTLPLDYKCDAGTDDIYGILQITDIDGGVTFAADDLVPFLSFVAD